MLLVLHQNMLLGTTLVEVPDVVGETQAAGTTTLETALFVVAVATAYSSTVPAGTIISQSPAAGIEAPEGSTATITVSLGERVNQGGGGPDPKRNSDYWYWLEKAREQIRQAQARKERIAEQVAKIPEKTDREIARILQADEEAERKAKELAEIREFAESASNVPSRRIRDLIRNALNEESERALLRLQAAMAKEIEDEEAIVMALLMMD